jgi:hypothetical protein
MASDTPLDPPESRWPAVVAVLAVGGIYLALPASLAVGPRWLQLVIVLILVVPTVITHRRGNHALNQILGHALAGVTTLFMVLLVLAFNTSTAFSPTDTPVLSRWAKVLTMLQCTISLTVVIVLAARAVNIL